MWKKRRLCYFVNSDSNLFFAQNLFPASLSLSLRIYSSFLLLRFQSDWLYVNIPVAHFCDESRILLYISLKLACFELRLISYSFRCNILIRSVKKSKKNKCAADCIGYCLPLNHSNDFIMLPIDFETVFFSRHKKRLSIPNKTEQNRSVG